jgi:hypothetical protein
MTAISAVKDEGARQRMVGGRLTGLENGIVLQYTHVQRRCLQHPMYDHGASTIWRDGMTVVVNQSGNGEISHCDMSVCTYLVIAKV